jgi:hypothetical protein
MVIYSIKLIFIAILGIKLVKPVKINKLLLQKLSEEVLGGGGKEHKPRVTIKANNLQTLQKYLILSHLRIYL